MTLFKTTPLIQYLKNMVNNLQQYVTAYAKKNQKTKNMNVYILEYLKPHLSHRTKVVVVIY